MYKVIDNFLPIETADKLYNDWPKEDNTCWYKRTDLFQKNQYGCNNPDLFPKSIKDVIDYFQSNEFIEFLTNETDVHDLQKDEFLHGGGIVQYGTGGYLDKHLD